ncbi:MarR family winged helix-turn-helix transcriptional regulator [Eubacterium oxidoreducens]|uniref:DNA-binding transcriptional regulator, MarR family n=1 Tax=Eubacterium oxidoreducens TaxID=1732 RepID=A0A1G6BTM8_EUBOX|nr:MarR family winged helix-turn-helix transcriptional regulator [Eubacterium oxidoreducens]SDB24001.1 DNA-binding transcriptional regulator, MarR family [Eubacterium oxidoreducens]
MKHSLAMEVMQAVHQFSKLQLNKLTDLYTLREEQVMITMAKAKHVLGLDEIPVSLVCEQMNMSAASASRLFRSLEEKGIIERRSAKECKRNTVLILTEYGMMQCKELHKRGEEFFDKILGQIEEERIRDMISLLNELYHTAKAELDNYSKD